jgi:hypothetical protein
MTPGTARTIIGQTGGVMSARSGGARNGGKTAAHVAPGIHRDLILAQTNMTISVSDDAA